MYSKPAYGGIRATAMVGNDSDYGRILEYGCVITPKNGVYLGWQDTGRPDNPSGIWRHRSVNLPPHPYLRPTTDEAIEDGSLGVSPSTRSGRTTRDAEVTAVPSRDCHQSSSQFSDRRDRVPCGPRRILGYNRDIIGSVAEVVKQLAVVQQALGSMPGDAAGLQGAARHIGDMGRAAGAAAREIQGLSAAHGVLSDQVGVVNAQIREQLSVMGRA